jgi:hypothetical protein
MSEAQLQKVELELDKLKTELDVCKNAENTSKSCGLLVDFSESEAEAFSAGAENNPWHAGVGGKGPCVIL